MYKYMLNNVLCFWHNIYFLFPKNILNTYNVEIWKGKISCSVYGMVFG